MDPGNAPPPSAQAKSNVHATVSKQGRTLNLRPYLVTTVLVIAVLIPVYILGSGFWHMASGIEGRVQWENCVRNLRYLDLALRVYALEDPLKRFPALSSEPGRLMFDNAHVLTRPTSDTPRVRDMEMLICPSDSDMSHVEEKEDSLKFMLNDRSYFYLGYAVQSDEEVERFIAAYREAIEKRRGFEDDLTVDQQGAASTVYRLRDGIERSLASDGSDGAASRIRSRIPIVIERPGNHKPGDGANVLYMDGHIEWILYPGKWPLSERTIQALQSIDTASSLE